MAHAADHHARGALAWSTAALLAVLATSCASGGEEDAIGGGPNPGGPNPGGPNPGGGNTAPALAMPTPLSVPGTTYYVDADNGDDENAGLTPQTALRTLTRGVSQLSSAGGDRLVLKGVFRESLLLNNINNRNANAARPTVIQCAFASDGTPEVAHIDGGLDSIDSFPFDQRNLPPGFGPGTGNYLDTGITINASNYITVSGIVVTGIAGRGVFTWRSSHLNFEFMTVQWTSQSAMLMSAGNPGEPDAEDLVVAHSLVNQCNLGVWQNQATKSGFNMRTEALSIVQFDGFTVRDSTVSNSWMQGIDFKRGAKNGVIRNNVVENVNAAAIYCNEGDDTQIFQNVVRHVGWYDPQDGSGLQLTAPFFLRQTGGLQINQTGSVGILIGNGDLSPWEAFESGRSSGIWVYENEVSWTRKGAISAFNEWRVEGKPGSRLDDLHIFNNVAYKNGQGTLTGPAAITVDVSCSHSEVSNNITMASNIRGIHVFDASKGNYFASSSIANNLFWSNSSNGDIGANPIFGNPLFMETGKQPGDPTDFSLQAGSPAIGSGLPIGLIGSGSSAIDVGARQSGATPWTAGVGWTAP